MGFLFCFVFHFKIFLDRLAEFSIFWVSRVLQISKLYLAFVHLPLPPMHIDFVIPVNGSLSVGFEAYVKKAKGSVMDYGFHMAIMKWDETISREMEIMVKEKGINSFKFFMAYKGSFMSNNEHRLEGFKKCKSLGALALVHAENGDVVFEGQKRMIELGIMGTEGHVLSRPPVVNSIMF